MEVYLEQNPSESDYVSPYPPLESAYMSPYPPNNNTQRGYSVQGTASASFSHGGDQALAPIPANTASMMGPSSAQVNNASSSQTVSPEFSWNNLADQVVLTGYRAEQKISEIAIQLKKNGYHITYYKIRDSLRRQGVDKIKEKLDLEKPLPWDTDAEAFALALHGRGQTVQQITTQLCKDGCAVTVAQVAARLNR